MPLLLLHCMRVLYSGLRSLYDEAQDSSREEVLDTYEKYAGQLIGLIDDGFAGAVYTQTTDVEIEVNGLMTYDRKVLKYNPAVLKAAHEAIIRRASESAKENREVITP